MMKSLFVAIFAVCLLSLAACNNSMSEERQLIISQLRADLQTVETTLQDLEAAPVDSLVKACGEAMNVVQDYYSDSVSHPKEELPYDEMITLSDFRSSYKSMKKWKENFVDRRKDIALRNQQLDDLEADLINGVISDEDYEVGIQSETKAIKEILTDAERMPAWLDKAQSRYFRHRPKVDSLLITIEQKLQLPPNS